MAGLGLRLGLGLGLGFRVKVRNRVTDRDRYRDRVRGLGLVENSLDRAYLKPNGVRLRVRALGYGTVQLHK